jgi:septum site-determining protein MinD
MIVAVCSGKGGVGKSTVAYNLAAALDGVVVDADLGMADLPDPRGPDLQDVLAGRAAPVDAVRDGRPVALLPCGRSLARARLTDPRALLECVAAVETAYGSVVIDCPAGMGGAVGLALCAADGCLLVTTPRKPALSDAIRTRALARELGTGLVGIVLNRAGESAPVDAVATELGAAVTDVPESPVLARSQAAGRPVVQAASECPAARRLTTLAERVQSSLSS